MNKVHVKKNDQVVVISGPKDGDKAIKGKQGKILTVDPKAGKVIVEGVAYVTKHQKREDGSKKKKIVRVCKRCKADID